MKCDLPEPRPPYAPLYLAGSSSGRKTLAVWICRIDNGPLNAAYGSDRVGIIVAHKGLWHLAVQAITKLLDRLNVASLGLLNELARYFAQSALVVFRKRRDFNSQGFSERLGAYLSKDRKSVV